MNSKTFIRFLFDSDFLYDNRVPSSQIFYFSYLLKFCLFANVEKIKEE